MYVEYYGASPACPKQPETTKNTMGDQRLFLPPGFPTPNCHACRNLSHTRPAGSWLTVRANGDPTPERRPAYKRNRKNQPPVPSPARRL